MPYRIIAAMSRNYGIGYRGGMPWDIKTDMARFSKLTKGSGNNAVVMGRNTWHSINANPLKGRANIVLSSNPSIVTNKSSITQVVSDIPELVDFCQSKNYDDIWIIGGANIYKQFLTNNLCAECQLTYISKDYPSDVYFPYDDCLQNWQVKHIEFHEEKVDEPHLEFLTMIPKKF